MLQIHIKWGKPVRLAKLDINKVIHVNKHTVSGESLRLMYSTLIKKEFRMGEKVSIL